MYTSEKIDKFIELRAQGWSLNHVATELRVAKRTLVEWSRAQAAQINSLRALLQETAQEKLAACREEEANFAGFVALATALFAGGMVFAYFVVLPPALRFLTNYDDQIFNIQIRAREYLTFATVTILAVAVVFELPIFVLSLVRIGVLSSEKLRRNRRTGIVIVVVVAVLLPSVDPVSLVFEAVPLLILFEGSIWLSVFFEKRWREPERLASLAQ